MDIERLLKAVVSQDIISVVQNASVVDTSDLQTELERTKERFENCIIKKETEYAKLWNDRYKKCDECKYDKISYDKAYKDMQQKIERLQAQLGDLKGKSKDTSRVSNTLNPLSQKLKNANVELEFQNTKFVKQPIAEILPKIGETNALSKQVTSNSVSTPPVSKGVNYAKVIAPGMFRICPDKVSKEATKVPNTKNIVIGLPKLKYVKDQLCSLCELGKAKRSTFKTKTVSSSKGRLNLLYIDLCGPMRIESINGKKYSGVSYDNSGPTPHLQQTFDHNSLELRIQDHNNEPLSSKLVLNVSPPTDINAPSLQELDFLFSPLFEEYNTGGNQSVSKSFALSDNYKQQDTQPTPNI
nr:ribonuclease H-like domain-containing protein [Tanacetum cinerariifolium]